MVVKRAHGVRLLTVLLLSSLALFAQNYPPPPAYPPPQLDQLVARIALYPDPLLAQVLTASTYANEIPDAAAWSRAHSYLNGDQLAHAIDEDHLPWDPSVLGLLAFPSVLNQLAGDMSWTEQLGNAVLADRAAVMDAVQRQRQLAMNYGYLQSNAYYRVVPAPGAIEIVPVDPAFIYVPFYNPAVVFFRPRPGFFVGGAITFGPRIFIGGAFAPFGWGGIGLNWRSHAILLNHRPWERTWANRGVYVHRYDYVRPRAEGPRMERHEMHEWHEPEHRAPERHERH